MWPPPRAVLDAVVGRCTGFTSSSSCPWPSRLDLLCLDTRGWKNALPPPPHPVPHLSGYHGLLPLTLAPSPRPLLAAPLLLLSTPGASSVSDEVLNLMKREIDKVKGGLRIVDAKLDEVKELVLNMSRQTFAVGPVPPEYMLQAGGGWVQGPRSRGGEGGGANGGAKGVGPPERVVPPAGSDVGASTGNGGDVGPGRRDVTGLPVGSDGADDYYSVQPLMRHQHRPSQQQQQQEQHWWYPHHLHTHMWPPSRDQYYGGRDVHAQSRHSTEVSAGKRAGTAWVPTADGRRSRS